MTNLVVATTDRFGRLDVMVNNAGVGPVSYLRERKVDEWDLMIEVNLRGASTGSPRAYRSSVRRSSGSS